MRAIHFEIMHEDKILAKTKQYVAPVVGDVIVLSTGVFHITDRAFGLRDAHNTKLIVWVAEGLG